MADLFHDILPATNLTFRHLKPDDGYYGILKRLESDVKMKKKGIFK